MKTGKYIFSFPICLHIWPDNESLESPLSITKYLSLTKRNWLQSHKHINMKSLNFRFWKFFSIDTMLFSKRKMNSNLSFVEVDIRKGSGSRNRWIESETELSNHDFSLIFDHPIIEFLECRREVRRGKHSSFFDNELEWLTNIHREILIRKTLDKTITMNTLEIDCLCEDFTNREGSAFIFHSCIISRISPNGLKWSKCEYWSIDRLYLCCLSRLSKVRKFFLESYIFIRPIL